MSRSRTLSSRRLFGSVVLAFSATALVACDDEPPPNRPIPDAAVEGGVEMGGGDMVVVPPAEAGVEMGGQPDMEVVPPPPPMMGDARKTPTNGGAVVIASDDSHAVAVNRTAGRVSLFRLDFASATAPATKVVDVDVGRTAEPWAAVLSNDDNTAYVILRQTQRIVRFRNLKTSYVKDAMELPTGSEPTSIAISPLGATLYVANWADGTVTVVDTATWAVTRTIDLNPALAASGYLGAGVAARPALAHPRAIAVTNNGDKNDADETVYVTEFFSQARTDMPLPTDDSLFDVGRQGVVYHFNAGTGMVGAPITIAPVADTGFVDSKGATTGCFPNQLYAATINSGRLYVTSVCQSPRGPVGPDMAPMAPGVGTSNFKTQIHSAIFVIDTATNKELPAQGLLLPREFDKLYNTAPATPDDASRRLPLIPNDIAFATGSTFAYVSSYGSDAVFRIAYKADGTLERVGAATQKFINLKPGGAVSAGELPVGIASANRGSFALAINENSRNLSVITFGTQLVLTAVSAAAPPEGAEEAANKGRKFFVTGLGRWSLNGQGWNSCEACHPDGLTDNVTWFFARGPRQTTSLDATYDPTGASRRVLNWTGIFDAVIDFELNTRGNSGGVGAIVHANSNPPVVADRIAFDGTAPAPGQMATATNQAFLSGSSTSLMPNGTNTPKSVLNDWNEIDAYVKTIRAPRAPTGLVPADITAGRALFESNGCNGCHGSAQWTIAKVFYTKNETNNGMGGALQTVNYTLPAMFPVQLNPPAMTGRMAPLRINPATNANDQLNCVLRDVGTFPMAGTAGIAPAGVTVKEVRQDMTTLAQGATGFNIPSLVGMGTGAPYFHAGAARTLEEALGMTFERHRRAFAENFNPDATQLKQLVTFLLYIDDTTAAPAAANVGFPVDLCKEIPAGSVN